MTLQPTNIQSDEIGSLDDNVQLVLNGQQILKAESWEIRESVLSQPACWSIRLGHGDIAKPLLAAAPPRSLFELYVGAQLQFTGFTDSRGARQSEGGGTEVEIRGRDALAPLHDTYVKAAVNVNVSTYAQLVWYALQQCGIVSGSTIDPDILATDNAANRQIKAGVPIRSILPHRTVQQILDDAGINDPKHVGIVNSTPQAKLNETWHHFLRRHLDRAGLFLWAGVGGTSGNIHRQYVLSAPNGDQPPSYMLRRRTGQPNLGANVVSMDFDEDTTHRHSECVVYGRGGGRKFGRVKAKGGFTDQEMIDLGFIKQPIVFRDANVHSTAEAAFFARRKIAEERRAGWRLEYTIAGNTLPFLLNGNESALRAVVVPDTTIVIEDDQLGLQDKFYIEGVTRKRSPQTTTSIRLMRIADIIFATPEEAP